MSPPAFDGVMGTFFSRLGILGVSVLVVALLFGGVAGGVTVYRLTSASHETSQTQEEDQQGDQSDQDKSDGTHKNNQPAGASQEKDQQGESEPGD